MQTQSPCAFSDSKEGRLFRSVPTVPSILEEVDKYISSMELDTIDRIEQENDLLRQSIDCHHKTWYYTLDLLREAFEAMVLLEVSLSDHRKAINEAKTQWVISSQAQIWGRHSADRATRSGQLQDG